MPIVTDLRKRRGLIEIEADGATAVRVRCAHFAKCPVDIDDEIDLEAYARRVAVVQLADGYEAALGSLDYCARSADEIARLLRRKGYVEPAIEAVLERLTESGLIDDARYAQRLAQLSAAQPVGVYAFKRKLRSKGISEEDAEEALAAFDDDQQRTAALEAARKLLRRYASLPQREARARLSHALARRGFSWETVEYAVEKVME